MSYANITRSWLLKLAYKIRSPIFHKITYKFAIKIHKVVLCKKEHIFYSSIDGSTINFCEACGKQTNYYAYMDYEITLFDNTKVTVKAVNEQHAKSQVIYDNTSAIDGKTGRPLANTVLHPNNIKSVHLIR
jgi:hypothetical protein